MIAEIAGQEDRKGLGKSDADRSCGQLFRRLKGDSSKFGFAIKAVTVKR